MIIGYRKVRKLLFLLVVGLSLAGCAQIQDIEQKPTLVYIEVAPDVGPVSAQVSVDGDRKGYVGPGCQLIFAVNAGVRTITYQWDAGSVERDVEALAGKTLIVHISRGPKIILPMAPDQSDACST